MFWSALLDAGANSNAKFMQKILKIVELLLATKGVDDVDSGLAMATGTQSEELIALFLNTKKVCAQGLPTSSPTCWEDRITVTTADQEGDNAGFAARNILIGSSHRLHHYPMITAYVVTR